MRVLVWGVTAKPQGWPGINLLMVEEVEERRGEERVLWPLCVLSAGDGSSSPGENCARRGVFILDIYILD